MKLFECQNCGQLLYFENTGCERCGHVLGQVREVLEILVWECSLEGLALRPVLASYS